MVHSVNCLETFLGSHVRIDGILLAVLPQCRFWCLIYGIRSLEFDDVPIHGLELVLEADSLVVVLCVFMIFQECVDELLWRDACGLALLVELPFQLGRDVSHVLVLLCLRQLFEPHFVRSLLVTLSLELTRLPFFIEALGPLGVTLQLDVSSTKDLAQVVVDVFSSQVLLPCARKP